MKAEGSALVDGGLEQGTKSAKVPCHSMVLLLISK